MLSKGYGKGVLATIAGTVHVAAGLVARLRPVEALVEAIHALSQGGSLMLDSGLALEAQTNTRVASCAPFGLLDLAPCDVLNDLVVHSYPVNQSVAHKRALQRASQLG